MLGEQVEGQFVPKLEFHEEGIMPLDSPQPEREVNKLR
jgi:hypothetical protein